MATDTADASMLYQHRTRSVEVDKSPAGQLPPGNQIPFELSFTNTGNGPIVDPVITDVIPADAEGPQLILDRDLPDGTSHYGFELSGAAPSSPNGPAMPISAEDVTVDATPELITFAFPPGSVIEPGQT